MFKRLVIYFAILGAVVAVIFSMIPSRTAAREVALATDPRLIIVQTSSTLPTVDQCTVCHREKETLERLAEKQAEKSEETEGEG